MKPHLRYAWYVARHKWFVLLAGRLVGAPLWRLVIHDWTKLTPAEWGPYVRRFYGGRAGQLDKAQDPTDFHRAWTQHWHRNPHHWEHWLFVTDDGRLQPMEMPEGLAREMAADWMGAGRAITGEWDVQTWYAENYHRILLHPRTRELVDILVGL